MAVRREHGRWRFRVVIKLPDGSKTRLCGTPAIDTKDAARVAERQAIERALDPKPITKEVPKLRPFAEEFMTNYAAVHNKPSERHTKRLLLDRYILPTLGDRRLDEITAREIDALRARIIAPGNTAKYANNVAAVLTRILRYAHECEVVDKLPRTRPLKVVRREMDFLNEEELDRLLGAAEKEPMLHVALTLGAYAGLRRGEILALRWEDVDLKATTPQLVVSRAMWEEHEGTPKGGRSRKVPLASRLHQVLKANRHLNRNVVVREDGSPWNRNITENAIARATRRAGLRSIGWHTLRHTFCSHLAMKGAPVKTIQELAGHADLTTTLRYMHLAPKALVEAVRLLDQRGEAMPKGAAQA